MQILRCGMTNHFCNVVWSNHNLSFRTCQAKNTLTQINVNQSLYMKPIIIIEAYHNNILMVTDNFDNNSDLIQLFLNVMF